MSMAARKKEATLELPKKGALFEVRNAHGAVMAQTEYPSCYPDRARREELRKAGYKLYLDGKVFREEKK